MAALAACVAVPPFPKIPMKEAETSVGMVHISLLNFTGVGCFQNAPRCRFLFDVRRKGREFRKRERDRRRSEGDREAQKK